MPKTVVFVTGTRADYGKLRPLARAATDHALVSWFVTGMHMEKRHGETFLEVEREWDDVQRYYNRTAGEDMDRALARTVEGLSDYVRHRRPDLLVVHGDRPEALAGAIVGAMTNTLVAHVEGGERSGSVDEGVRHAVTKLAHVHLVANDDAAELVARLGEHPQHIHAIGSPEVDGMVDLPTLDEVRRRYEIEWTRYGVLLLHPVTTESEDPTCVLRACQSSSLPWVCIRPNSDRGAGTVNAAIDGMDDERFRKLPSMRFSHFQTLLGNARVIVGNSSAGIREAPCWGTPSVNVGSRQNGRKAPDSVLHVPCNADAIRKAIAQALEMPTVPTRLYGDGHAAERFAQLLKSKLFWETSKQKVMM